MLSAKQDIESHVAYICMYEGLVGFGFKIDLLLILRSRRGRINESTVAARISVKLAVQITNLVLYMLAVM